MLLSPYLVRLPQTLRQNSNISSHQPHFTVASLYQKCNFLFIPVENVTSRNYQVEVEVIEEQTTIIEELMTPTFIALAASVAAATVIVILLIGLICHRLCRHKPGYIVAKTDNGEIDLAKLPQNSNYHTTGATLHPKLEVLEYPRNDIIYIRDIGQGAFGRVFQVVIAFLVSHCIANAIRF